MREGGAQQQGGGSQKSQRRQQIDRHRHQDEGQPTQPEPTVPQACPMDRARRRRGIGLTADRAGFIVCGLLASNVPVLAMHVRCERLVETICQAPNQKLSAKPEQHDAEKPSRQGRSLEQRRGILDDVAQPAQEVWDIGDPLHGQHRAGRDRVGQPRTSCYQLSAQAVGLEGASWLGRGWIVGAWFCRRGGGERHDPLQVLQCRNQGSPAVRILQRVDELLCLDRSHARYVATGLCRGSASGTCTIGRRRWCRDGWRSGENEAQDEQRQANGRAHEDTSSAIAQQIGLGPPRARQRLARASLSLPVVIVDRHSCSAGWNGQDGSRRIFGPGQRQKVLQDGKSQLAVEIVFGNPEPGPAILY